MTQLNHDDALLVFEALGEYMRTLHENEIIARAKGRNDAADMLATMRDEILSVFTRLSLDLRGDPEAE